ncbi:hypothetical protein C1H46_035619 [Malus baccata]|uniref:GST N-terminal domain-containing protein n=1 Tax=Malus baccata TaxID=106549 RepID=A0A540KXM5_MALBA|nr:hypothetical protein C1H46_035619 [Malus baccata]
MLLRYNHIHKKVLILVHGEKPVAEFLVILEYINETWRDNPLLPEDPFEKATVQFWANPYYLDDASTTLQRFLPSNKTDLNPDSDISGHESDAPLWLVCEYDKPSVSSHSGENERCNESYLEKL